MIVPLDDAYAMTLAALRRGGVVVLPTDTVYGLVAVASDATATAKLFAQKGRDETKSIAVLVADLDQARALTADDLDACARWWPGPLTAVVRRAAGAALHLGGDDSTVGVRCPAHPFVRRLAAALGPLAATSANPAGEPTPATAAGVAAVFPDVAVVVDGGLLGGAASTVVDCTVSPPRLLRAGPIPADALGAVAETPDALGAVAETPDALGAVD